MNLIITEQSELQSQREVSVYNSLAAYSKAVNELIKTDTTKSFVNMLPVPKVFAEHIELLKKAKEQEQAAHAAKMDQQAKPIEVLVPVVNCADADEAIPPKAIQVQDSAIEQKKRAGRPPLQFKRN